MIERILAGRATAPDWLQVDAGDDAAVFASGQVVTVDTLVEGVHFDHRLTPADVGYKSVAVSVSDLAAMGARPRWMVCALSMPRSPDLLDWVDQFATGLRGACDQFDVHLVGGDVTSVPAGGPRFVSNTLVGQVTAAGPLRRDAARPGDDLWVTGAVGLAGAGWMLQAPLEPALAALRRPIPPLDFAVALAEAGLVHAAMDLSDGLGADVPRLATASGVRLHIDANALPVVPGLPAGDARLRAQLRGGDDYQLLFTAPPSSRPQIEGLARLHSIRVTCIGHASEGAGAALSGDPWPTNAAYDHFPAGTP